MSKSYWERLAEDAKKMVDNAQKAVSSAAVTEELEQAKIFFTSPNPERDLAARKARAAGGEGSGEIEGGEAGGGEADGKMLDFDMSEQVQEGGGAGYQGPPRGDGREGAHNFEGKTRDELAGLLRASLQRVKAGERRAQELVEEREMHKQRADSLASMLSEAASPRAPPERGGVTDAEVEGLQASLRAVKDAAAADKRALAEENDTLGAEKVAIAADRDSLAAEVAKLKEELKFARADGERGDGEGKAKAEAAEQRVAFLEAQLAQETAKKVAAREKLESVRQEMGASKEHHKKQIEEQSKVLAALEKLKKEAGEHKAAAESAATLQRQNAEESEVLRGEIGRLEAVVAELESKVTWAQQGASESEGLRGEIGRLEAVVADLEKGLALAQEAQEALLSSRTQGESAGVAGGADSQGSASVEVELQAKIAELERQAGESKRNLEAQLSDMITVLDQANVKTEEMKVDKAKAIKEALNSREECKRLTAELDEVSRKLKQSQMASSEIAEERDRLTSSFDAKIDILEAKMAEQREDEVCKVKKEYGEQLTQRNQEMASMTEELGREMVGLKARYDEILGEKDTEVEELSRKVRELEAAAEVTSSAEGVNKEIALRGEVDDLKQELEKARLDLVRVSKKFEADRDTSTKQIERLQAELCEAQQRPAGSEVPSADAAGAPASASEREADWRKAVEALNAERIRSGSLAEKLKEIETQKQEAEKSLEEIREKFTKLQALAKEKLAKAEEKAKVDADTLTSIQVELGEEKEKVEEATERLANQERKLKAAWAKVREAERNRDNEKLRGSGKMEEVKEAVRGAEEKVEAHKRKEEESNERLRNALEQIGVLTENLGGLQARLREADEDSAQAEERWGLERAQLREEVRRSRQGELDNKERLARAESEAAEASERLRADRHDFGMQIRTLRGEVESLQAELAQNAERLALASKLHASAEDQRSSALHSERVRTLEENVRALEVDLENARAQLAARDRREDKDRAGLSERLAAAEARVQELQSQAAVLREEKEMANRRAAQAIRDAALVDRSGIVQGGDLPIDPAEARGGRASREGLPGGAPSAAPLRERRAGENGALLDWSKKLARKEAELLRAANEVRTLQSALEESEATSELQVAQQEVLKGEIARMRGEVERAQLSASGGVELEYVKNVVVKLLTLKGSHAPEGESDTLAAALCRVLRLSPPEIQAVEEARRQRRSGTTQAAAVFETLGAQMATLGASMLPAQLPPSRVGR